MILLENVPVKTTTDAPPLQFEEAERRLSAFLARNGYPSHVCWVTRRDVLVDDSGVLLIKKSETAAEEQSRLYGSGVTSGLGVALVAVCATSTSTYANVFAPKDVLDAQEHLLGAGLKLSCPVTRHPVRVIENRLAWYFYSLRHHRRSKLLELS